MTCDRFPPFLCRQIIASQPQNKDYQEEGLSLTTLLHNTKARSRGLVREAINFN